MQSAVDGGLDHVPLLVVLYLATGPHYLPQNSLEITPREWACLEYVITSINSGGQLFMTWFIVLKHHHLVYSPETPPPYT